jgi:hypothetical protein
MELTPNAVPYWVVFAKLNVMFMVAAPSVGVKPPKDRFPLAGAVSAPSELNVSVCVVPTWVPFTVMSTSQVPGVAVCVK